MPCRTGVQFMYEPHSGGDIVVWTIMIEDFGKRLFEALQEDAVVRLGSDHPCVSALLRAIETNEPTDIQDAQEHLSALPEHFLEPMMRAAHKSLREDPGALLTLWTGGPSKNSN